MSKSIFFPASEEDLRSEGLTPLVAVWEDGLRTDTRRGTFEWWYFDAHFEDGSTAVIVFSTKPLLERQGPLKPNVALTITRLDGSRIMQLPLLPADQFHAASDICDVHIGAHWARGDLHRYEVHVQLKGLSADLTFTGLVPAWRPGAGKAYFGDRSHYFAWLPAIPHGTVAGTLHYDGKTHSVKGTGYHDHNWGNLSLNRIMHHWYWGRAHVGGYTAIFVEQVTAKAYGEARVPVFLLAQGDRILVEDGRPLLMAAREFEEHPGGRRYPREVDFRWQMDSESVHLRLRRPRIIEATSLLLFLPKWQQRLARRFSNPYYFRFNAELELEIHLSQLRDTQKGSALYEIMLLQ